MLMEIDLNEQIETFLNSVHSEVLEDEKHSKRKEEKGTYFGVILYPDEDPRHLNFMNYIISRPSYEYLYIRHDGEGFDKDGNKKKDHVHMMIHTLDRMAVGSFVKFFSGWIEYAECIHFPKTYVYYLLHDTPNALQEGKKHYSLSDLKGDEKFFKHLVQNSHFVQLEEILSYHPDGGSFLDTYHHLPTERKKYLGEWMYTNRYFVQGVIRDENQKYYNYLSWQGGTKFTPSDE